MPGSGNGEDSEGKFVFKAERLLSPKQLRQRDRLHSMSRYRETEAPFTVKPKEMDREELTSLRNRAIDLVRADKRDEVAKKFSEAYRSGKPFELDFSTDEFTDARDFEQPGLQDEKVKGEKGLSGFVVRNFRKAFRPITLKDKPGNVGMFLPEKANKAVNKVTNFYQDTFKTLPRMAQGKKLEQAALLLYDLARSAGSPASVAELPTKSGTVGAKMLKYGWKAAMPEKWAIPAARKVLEYPAHKVPLLYKAIRDAKGQDPVTVGGMLFPRYGVRPEEKETVRRIVKGAAGQFQRANSEAGKFSSRLAGVTPKDYQDLGYLTPSGIFDPHLARKSFGRKKAVLSEARDIMGKGWRKTEAGKRLLSVGRGMEGLHRDSATKLAKEFRAIYTKLRAEGKAIAPDMKKEWEGRYVPALNSLKESIGAFKKWSGKYGGAQSGAFGDMEASKLVRHSAAPGPIPTVPAGARRSLLHREQPAGNADSLGWFVRNMMRYRDQQRAAASLRATREMVGRTKGYLDIPSSTEALDLGAKGIFSDKAYQLYGMAAGKKVNPHYFREAASAVGWPSGGGKKLQRLKWALTSGHAGVQGQNLGGNAVTSFLEGDNPIRAPLNYLKGLKWAYSKDPKVVLQRERFGRLGMEGTLPSAEDFNSTLGWLNEIEERALKKGMAADTDAKLAKLMAKPAREALPVKVLSKLYGNIELAAKKGRMDTLKQMAKTGKAPTIRKRMQEAEDSFYDYNDVTDSLRWLRSRWWGPLFPTFAYKTPRLAARTAINHPRRYSTLKAGLDAWNNQRFYETHNDPLEVGAEGRMAEARARNAPSVINDIPGLRDVVAAWARLQPRYADTSTDYRTQENPRPAMRDASRFVGPMALFSPRTYNLLGLVPQALGEVASNQIESVRGKAGAMEGSKQAASFIRNVYPMLAATNSVTPLLASPSIGYGVRAGLLQIALSPKVSPEIRKMAHNALLAGSWGDVGKKSGGQQVRPQEIIKSALLGAPRSYNAGEFEKWARNLGVTDKRIENREREWNTVLK